MKVIIYILLFFIGICYITPQERAADNFSAGTSKNQVKSAQEINNPRDLAITTDDLVIVENTDGGYHLWIRADGSIGSVMITESTADPAKKNAVYALRSRGYNPVNGNEKRILDGKELAADKGLYFLIDSTTEVHEILGSAFHIFIPYIVDFGYSWSRNGEIYVTAGTFLNIRSFEKQFGDYTGSYMDNPFILDVIQVAAPKPEENYMKETVDNFTEIAKLGGGEIVYSAGNEKLLDDIGAIIDLCGGPTLDIVFAIDTTESMKNDFIILKSGFSKLLEEKTKNYEKTRVGLVYYKDYSEEYLTKPFPFTEDMAVIGGLVNSAKAWGGKDRPEAVYEALYECVAGYLWEADDRIVILIGDAPAHLKPKGMITKEIVFEKAGAKNVSIYTIILPP